MAQQLKPLPNACKTVFVSQFGEWQQTFDLIQEFHNEAQISPAGFSHSVHNAMPGIASVLSSDTNNYTTIEANEQTIDAGLLETCISPKPVLFIYAEEATPAFYKNAFKEPFNGYGIAFLVSCKKNECSRKITIEKQTNTNVANTTFKHLSDIVKNNGVLETPFLRITIDACD